jgi:hypothetical protein
VLAWALVHDAAIALRMATALAPWWVMRGRAAGQYPLLLEAARRAVPGSEQWCTARFWLGYMALHSDDQAGALGHFTAVIDAMRDRRPYPAVAYCLAGRTLALMNLGRVPEAAEDGRRSLAAARDVARR